MFVKRRKNKIEGIYQAICFSSKPPNSTGLRSGGYFISLQTCRSIQEHYSSRTSKLKRRKELLSEYRTQTNMAETLSISPPLIIKTSPYLCRQDYPVFKEQSIVMYPPPAVDNGLWLTPYHYPHFGTSQYHSFQFYN
jgi:hypothetical protein